MYIEMKGCAISVFKEYDGVAALVHQVNCQKVMGSGIALQIKNGYPEHFKDYIESEQVLGDTVDTYVEVDTKIVTGIFGQKEVGRGLRQTNYAALFSGIDITRYHVDSVSFFHKGKSKALILPKYIGCDRGGGDWKIVDLYLKELALITDVDIIVVEYDK